MIEFDRDLDVAARSGAMDQPGQLGAGASSPSVIRK
jgi:hypothetical protein